jgi:hypothetical protein
MRTFHTSLSVRGAIRWPDRELRNLVADENGDRFTPARARDWLASELAKGHEHLPIGRRCKGFTFRNGCPGHPS